MASLDHMLYQLELRELVNSLFVYYARGQAGIEPVDLSYPNFEHHYHVDQRWPTKNLMNVLIFAPTRARTGDLSVNSSTALPR